MRSAETESVAKLIHHINVLSGRWKSPYDVLDWRLTSGIPARLRPAVRMAEWILNPRYDWGAEAFRIEDDSPYLTRLHISMKSDGRAPLKVPFFGRPTLNLREVLSPLFSNSIEKFPFRLHYREFLMVEFPKILLFEPVEEDELNIDPDIMPAYDRIIIKPFWLFEGEGEREKAIAEDPFRLVFHLSGAPIAYIRQELQKLGIKIDQALLRVQYHTPGVW